MGSNISKTGSDGEQPGISASRGPASPTPKAPKHDSAPDHSWRVLAKCRLEGRRGGARRPPTPCSRMPTSTRRRPHASPTPRRSAAPHDQPPAAHYSSQHQPSTAQHASSAGSSAGFEQRFFTIVDEYLHAHPLQSAALDAESLRELTAWILFRQHEGGDSGPTPALDRGAAWLVAALLVLLVEEGLARGETRVLGVELEALYGLTAALVRDERVEHSEVCEVLATLPNGGRTLDVVRDRQSAAQLWQGAGDGGTRGGTGVASPMLVTSAGTVVVPAVRLKLAARFAHLRSWLFGIVVAPFVPIRAFQLLGDADGSADVPFFVLTLFASVLLFASCFPGTNDANNPAFSAFMFPASGGLVIFTAIESFHSYVYRVEPDVNDACRWVHLLLILGQMASKYTLCIAIFMHHAGWGLLRRVLACDGLLGLLSTLAYRVLGPPEVYPPGNVTFNMAIVRGLMFLMLSLVLTPSTRARAAALANRAGLNHVELKLREVPATSLGDAIGRTSPSTAGGAAEHAAHRAPLTATSNERASGSRAPWKVAMRELLLGPALHSRAVPVSRSVGELLGASQ